MRILPLILVFLLSAPQPAAAEVFRLDPVASRVTAKVSFLGLGSRSATFPEVTGAISSTRDAFGIDVIIDARSLMASDTLTTNRLKGPNFFDVTNHPTIYFKGNSLQMRDRLTGIVSGTLSVRGMNRPITLAVTFSQPIDAINNNQPMTLRATTTINRTDFGMTAYPIIVGKSVSIVIDARLSR